MRYILNMGLSGSIMCLFYICTKNVFAKCMKAKHRYLILKCVLLYYLVPIPFLKYLYNLVWNNLVIGKEFQYKFVTYAKNSLMLRWGDRIYLNQSMQLQLLTAYTWVGIAGLILFHKCVVYLSERKILSRYGNRGFDREDFKMHDVLENVYSVKQKVTYIDSTPADSGNNTAFTIGILHPLVLYPLHRSHEEKQMILGHELIHVKHKDVLWRILMSGVCILHWFNPLVWWLASEFEYIGEMACDERLLKDYSPQKKKQYAELVLTMSGKYMGANKWSVTLSRKNKRLKERLENIMGKDKRYIGGTASTLLIGLLVFLNSFTVLAYEDVKVWKFSGDESIEPQTYLECDAAFVADGESAPDITFWRDANVAIIYDCQFVDEQGNIFPVPEDTSGQALYANCSHEYVAGINLKHEKYSNGGCTIKRYSAKRCTKCGEIVQGEKISTEIFDICIH